MKAVIKLADNADDQGYCWPSYNHIAEMCEIDKRTAMRHIKELINLGYLEKKLRPSKNGNTSNMYHLTLEKPRGDNLSPPSDTGVTPLVTHDHPPSDRVSPESVNEPVNENIYSKFDFSKWPNKPSAEVFQELLLLRKRHKLSNSSLAFATIGSQMAISATNGYSVDQCIAQWVTSGWKTFKAEYMNSSIQQKLNTSDERQIIARKAAKAMAQSRKTFGMDKE